MKRKRFSEEQILGHLKAAEAGTRERGERQMRTANVRSAISAFLFICFLPSRS
jgi:hypothetical protein